MNLYPDVYLINGFSYNRWQNGFLIKTNKGAILVDSGDLFDSSFDDVQKNCNRWDLDLSSVSHLLITHAHFDHSSHAAKLRNMGIKIVASQDTAEAMGLGDDRCIGYAVGQTFEKCKTDIIVKDEQILEIDGLKIRCIEVPGHANGCIVYEMILDQQICWFSGDIVLTGIYCENIQLGWEGDPNYDRNAYLDSLKRLAHMRCDHLFPGHGPPCIGKGKWMIEKAYTKAMVEWRTSKNTSENHTLKI